MIHISSINVARRPTYVRLALWFLHHPAWMESHTGGSRLTPTVHPCPVPLGRLWVAYVSYEPNEPQEHAQPVHGSGARVQDHDPGTSQPETQTPRQSAAEQSSRSPPVSKVLKRCWRMPRRSQPSVRRTQQPSRRVTWLVPKTLVNAVENAEVNRNHSRSVSRIDTSQICRRRNSTRLPDLERRSPTRTTRPSDTKQCHMSSGQRLLQACMTKKKGKEARSAGAVNAARRAGETVETKTDASCLLPHKQTSRSTPFLSALIPLSLVVESTV